MILLPCAFYSSLSVLYIIIIAFPTGIIEIVCSFIIKNTDAKQYSYNINREHLVTCDKIQLFLFNSYTNNAEH